MIFGNIVTDMQPMRLQIRVNQYPPFSGIPSGMRASPKGGAFLHLRRPARGRATASVVWPPNPEPTGYGQGHR
jgi:hypothetical protein